VVNRQDRGRRSRPYAIVSIIGIAAGVIEGRRRRQQRIEKRTNSLPSPIRCCNGGPPGRKQSGRLGPVSDRARLGTTTDSRKERIFALGESVPFSNPLLSFHGGPPGRCGPLRASGFVKRLAGVAAIPIIGARRRGITLGKTDDLVSAPSRPYTVAWQGESGGSEIVVNRQDRGRRSRPYAIVSIIGIADDLFACSVR